MCPTKGTDTKELEEFIIKFWKENGGNYTAFDLAHEILNFLYWSGVIEEY
jgi:hypothetical protein